MRWYDDSKATTPGAVLAAVRGFDSAVLIAGGRNKGLDLSVLAAAVAAGPRPWWPSARRRAEVAAAFAGRGAGASRAPSMADAVDAAAGLARDRATPCCCRRACASFDWYASYAERGDDFARLVLARPGMIAGPILPEGSH